MTDRFRKCQHPKTPENTYANTGHVACRLCALERAAARRRKEGRAIRQLRHRMTVAMGRARRWIALTPAHVALIESCRAQYKRATQDADPLRVLAKGERC